MRDRETYTHKESDAAVERTAVLKRSASWRRAASILSVLAVVSSGLIGLAAYSGGSAAYSGGSAAYAANPTVAFIYKLPNPYFIAMSAAVKQWAAQHHVHLIVSGGKTPSDVSGQIAAVQTAITEGAKAIEIAPEGVELTPTLARAVQQGIPVVLVDTDLPAFKAKTSYVGTDNYKGAFLAGKFIRARLKRGQQLAIESGIPGVPTLDQRVQGVKDALKGSSIKIVAELPTQCAQDTGVSVTRDVLTAHPHIQGIYSACSPPTFGALTVLAQRGMTHKLLFVSFDGAPQEYQDIEAGTLTATVAQFPRKMGVIGLQLALKAAARKHVPKSVDAGQFVVSKANVAKFCSPRCNWG